MIITSLKRNRFERGLFYFVPNAICDYQWHPPFLCLTSTDQLSNISRPISCCSGAISGVDVICAADSTGTCGAENIISGAIYGLLGFWAPRHTNPSMAVAGWRHSLGGGMPHISLKSTSSVGVSTGSAANASNETVAFDVGAMALAPNFLMLAPWRWHRIFCRTACPYCPKQCCTILKMGELL